MAEAQLWLTARHPRSGSKAAVCMHMNLRVVNLSYNPGFSFEPIAKRDRVRDAFPTGLTGLTSNRKSILGRYLLFMLSLARTPMVVISCLPANEGSSTLQHAWHQPCKASWQTYNHPKRPTFAAVHLPYPPPHAVEARRHGAVAVCSGRQRTLPSSTAFRDIPGNHQTMGRMYPLLAATIPHPPRSHPLSPSCPDHVAGSDHDSTESSEKVATRANLDPSASDGYG